MKNMAPLLSISLMTALAPAAAHSQNGPPAQPQNCSAYMDRIVRVRTERIQDGNTIYLNYVLTRASGSIIGRDSTDYHILTAFHFIEPLVKNYQLTEQGVVPDTSMRTISVSFYDERPTRSATVDWYDEVLDIAVLKVPLHEDMSPLDPLVYGNSDQVKMGDEVFEMGHPLDLGYSMLKTMVAKERRNTADFSLNYMGRRIQLQSMAGAGISGGPLLNGQCELIGVVQFSRLDKARGAGFDMALPINYVARLLPLPKDNGRVMHAYLHMAAVPFYELAQPVQDYLKNRHGVREGILVTDVKTGSNAQRLDIRQGDIIFKFNTHRVSQISDITDRILFEYKPGDRITLELYRRGANGDYTKHKLEGPLTEARINYYEK